MPAEPSVAALIVQFASQICAADERGETYARARGWLDEAGRATADGLGLLHAIQEQRGTRSVFRGW